MLLELRLNIPSERNHRLTVLPTLYVLNFTSHVIISLNQLLRNVPESQISKTSIGLKLSQELATLISSI